VTEWWRRGAVYQIYPRSFQDSDGDGVGDLRGILRRLDHLRDLGVGAVWLSPFYPSPMADFGYDVADYTDVDPLFGSLGDFDALVKAAKERGIEVIVDWVGNHSSDRHPWFEASRSSRGDPRRDWYVWRDGESPPNDWVTAWKDPGPAWTWDERTAQWYLHSFLAEQPDLNWDDPDVERAMFDVLRFWLDRGVGGFRLDAVYKIGKDPALGDNEPGRSHQEHWPTVHDRLRRLRKVLEEYDGDRVSVGEIHADSQRTLVEYVNSGDELHMVHNFALVHAAWSAQAFRATIDEFTGLAEPDTWPAWCFSDHDFPRIASRYGEARARVAAMLLVTLRGTPFIYQGDELGLRDADVPPERIVDVDGRDPERAPIPWEAGPGAGFTTGRPWLPLPPDPERVNAEAQRTEPRSMLALYRELLALRGRSRALQEGRQEMLDAAPDVLAYVREHGQERLLVALNFSSNDVPVDADAGRILLSTDAQREPSPAELTLAPDEGVIVALD
jgi:alpha-glucosidase